jgi:hypothetical protein
LADESAHLSAYKPAYLYHLSLSVYWLMSLPTYRLLSLAYQYHMSLSVYWLMHLPICWLMNLPICWLMHQPI